jgi:hypothetical protein
VRVEVVSLDTFDVLANADRGVVAQQLLNVVGSWATGTWTRLLNEPVIFQRQLLERDLLVDLADVRRLFDGGPRRTATCVMDTGQPGPFSREAVVGAAQELAELIVFQQEDGDAMMPAYRVEQGLAAWPVRWVDGLTPRLR